MEEKYFKFNLNEYVKVKIKDKGYEHLYNEDKNLFRHYTNFRVRSIEERKSNEDQDGYIKMQMHEFIQNFANLGFDLPNYIDINILIYAGVD